MVRAERPAQEIANAGHRLLLDVDNTLLDFDGVLDDLRRRLVDDLGPGGAERYWRGFEELRDELGYADYLGALQRYRAWAGPAPT